MCLLYLVEHKNIKLQIRYVRDVDQRYLLLTAPVKKHANMSDIFYPKPSSSLVITPRWSRGGGLTQYILDASFVMWHDAPLSPIQNSLRLFCGCAANALVGTILAELLDTTPLEYTDSPGDRTGS